MELLKDRGLLPAPAHRVDDVVVPLDGGLRPAAAGVATALRRGGRRVDLVLEAKKMKWAFKVRRMAGAKMVGKAAQDAGGGRRRGRRRRGWSRRVWVEGGGTPEPQSHQPRDKAGWA